VILQGSTQIVDTFVKPTCHYKHQCSTSRLLGKIETHQLPLTTLINCYMHQLRIKVMIQRIAFM